MHLLRETDYAVQILRVLAKNKKKNCISLHQLAEETNISFLFLQKIARKLRLAGLIEAEQGIKGGYRLAVPASTLTLGRIVQVMEGKCALLPCLGSGECAKKGKCALNKQMGLINKQLVKMMDKVKLSQLAV